MSQAAAATGGLPRFVARLGLACLVLLGLVTTFSFVSVPLPPLPQGILAAATILLALLVNRIRGPGATVFLAVLSVIASIRYLFWRMSDTLDFQTYLQAFLGTGLVLAETYAVTALALGYLQTVWPLERKPQPLPPDSRLWPTVDVFIPTYNEDLAVVRPTVFAALAMDWPRDRLRVHILDDGRRADFRVFAAQCGAGYITRADNRHAKAGNLNHGLGQTGGELIAIFDCDHIPTRAFLQITIGWLVHDPRLAFVQTPHHFYSPDPIQRNLAAGRLVPAEGNMFYGLVQAGNDLWNAAFFCGSCAVIRRAALGDIGGFAVETVTEDAHTALRLHRAGWSSAYLRLPLAAGLSTERLSGYIGQRLRWARGMLQILRVDNPLFGRGLSLAQRLCYLNAMLHFLFAVPRVLLLAAPLAYLLFGQSIIAATPLALISYALPHLFHSTATNTRIHRSWRHSLWSEVYETLLALFLIRVTFATLARPSRGRFNVTLKGAAFEDEYFDARAVYPNLILAVLLGLGLARGVWIIVFRQPTSLDLEALSLNLGWAVFSLVVVLAALAVGRETRQIGNRATVRARLPVVALLADGRAIVGVSTELSLVGAALAFEQAPDLPPGAAIDLEFDTGHERLMLPARLLPSDANGLRAEWQLRGLADEARMVRVVFGRADAWLSWNDFETDRPLASLGRVLLSIAGLFRGRRRSAAAVSTPPRQPVGPLRERLVQAAGAIAFLAVLLGAAGGARGQTAAHVASQVNTGLLLPGAPLTPLGPAGPVAAPGTQPSPGLPLPGVAPSVAPPSAAPIPAQTRQVTWTMRDLGAAGPLGLRGDGGLQGLLFGIGDDEVVTDAKLRLSGAIAPGLISELTDITVTLNEQYVGTVPDQPNHPEFGPIEIAVNPVFFEDRNRLNFRFTGRYARDCNDPLSARIWAIVSDSSTLTVTLARLPARRDLARLPLPFSDQNLRQPLVLPFVLPADPGDGAVSAAAIVASWFGKLQAFRGVHFPVSDQPPAAGNAVLILTGSEAPAGLALPVMTGAITGPSIAEIANPNDPLGTLLVVAGRTPAEAIEAAKMLALASATLHGDRALVAAPTVTARLAYDAPGWIPTDRPVRFGELAETSALQGSGFVPGTMHVPFRVAPDLVTWRFSPFVTRIRYRAPPGPIVDLAVSRLDVGINGQFLGSYPLAPAAGVLDWLRRLVGWQPELLRARTAIPTYAIGGANDLQLFFDTRPLDRGACVAIPQDIHTGIDPDSTIDLSRGYHFTRLPDLALFAGAGLPFSRMADLSDTAIVLPERPTNVEIGAVLDLIGRIGGQTQYPVTGLAIARPGSISAVQDRHLLVVGTLSRMAAAAALLGESPYRMDGDRLQVVLPSPLAEIWRIFGDTVADERGRAAASLAEPLGAASGAVIGARSPYARDRSVVAVLGGSPQGVAGVVDALGDPKFLPNVRGDLVLIRPDSAISYRAGDVYTMGQLPLWLWPEEWLSDRPDLMVGLGVLAAGAIALALSRLIPRQRRRRLPAMRPEA